MREFVTVMYTHLFIVKKIDGIYRCEHGTERLCWKIVESSLMTKRTRSIEREREGYRMYLTNRERENMCDHAERNKTQV